MSQQASLHGLPELVSTPLEEEPKTQTLWARPAADVTQPASPSGLYDQLTLPGIDAGPVRGAKLADAERVFVNRNLKLADIEWFGFDMDYTLALYNQEAMDALSVRVTVDDMIRRGYPSSLRDLHFDTRFPIRGLLVDKQEGNILKMNRFKVITKGYHGTKRLSKWEIETLYTHKRVRPGTPRYHWIDTLFGLSEVTAYAAIVDALEARGGRVDYARVFQDVRDSIDAAHRDGRVHGEVTAHPSLYINPDPRLPETLHKLRSAGKKLFLLTNSPREYTEKVMSYIFAGPEGQCHGQYTSWRHYFDIIVTRAGKPGWFRGTRPFYECEGIGRKLAGGSLERGRIYEEGNLEDFERYLGVPGSQVLYVGDHIYGDILKSKKESAWHTALVVQELDQELSAHALSCTDMARQRELRDAREALEDNLRFHARRMREWGQQGDRDPSGPSTLERARAEREMNQLRIKLSEVNAAHADLDRKINHRFHPYWGSLLKEHAEMSSFGVQVSGFADIYMRSVSCLCHYSPRQFFRSTRDLMPHES